MLAAFFNLVGLTFEALRWQPQSVNIALVFNGFYCLLIGYLIFKSTFLPRILGALVAFAGLGWLTYLSTALANYPSPYNLASGLLAEGSVMLWLLVMGVNVQRWKEQGAQHESRAVYRRIGGAMPLSWIDLIRRNPETDGNGRPKNHKAGLVCPAFFRVELVRATWFVAQPRILSARSGSPSWFSEPGFLKLSVRSLLGFFLSL